jgi:hypothetical protein
MLREECSPSVVSRRTLQAESYITRLTLIPSLDVDGALATRGCWSLHIVLPLDTINPQDLRNVGFVVLCMAGIADRHVALDAYEGYRIVRDA